MGETTPPPFTRDHDLAYTPEVRGRMSASARAAWQRRKAAGFVSHRCARAVAMDLYRALKGLMEGGALDQALMDPRAIRRARRALKKADGR